MRYKYLVIIEKGEDNYGAYAPDVPGCITTGKTLEETISNFHEALQFHLEGTFEDGDPAPYPYSVHAQFVEVEVDAPEPIATAASMKDQAVQSHSA